MATNSLSDPYSDSYSDSLSDSTVVRDETILSSDSTSDRNSDSSFLNEITGIILHKKELKKTHKLHPDIVWMLSASRLFTPLPPNPNVPFLNRQSYQRWKVLFDSHKLLHPKRSRNRTIILQSLIHSLLACDYPMSQVEVPLLECLRQFCTVYFRGATFLLDHSPIDLSSAKKMTSRIHDQTQRGQLLVDDVVKYMRSCVSTKCFCVVGITLIDLYPGENWNFTLGEAHFADSVAVCSFGRHFNSDIRHSKTYSQLYKQIGNLWVLLRVVTHEICHLFGLTHCFYFYCAMNESASINEAISQPLFLCPICLRKLHKVLKFNVQERYNLLRMECCKLLDMVIAVANKEIGCVAEEQCPYFVTSSVRTAIDWLEQCLLSFV